MRKTKKIGGSNVLVTVLLFLGCLTILFPLYMTIIIAFKNPSEMTNDVAGALAFPSSWKLDNFKEAMEVTNFWHTLGNSLLITIATIVLALAGWLCHRQKHGKKKRLSVHLFLHCKRYVRSVCNPDDAVGKGNCDSWLRQSTWCNSAVSGFLYAD